MTNKEEYLQERPLHADMRERVKEDKNRLHYHLMPPTGWMNDPNGLCQFQGVYHVYFQYTPFLAGWGTKLWGHYTTTDWLTFHEEEPFLFPDCDWDRDGVYSGSAFVENGRIHYFYTGNVKLHDKPYDYIMEGREQNTIHVVSEDGLTPSAKQLVLTNDDYPSDLSKHVRDPKIYKRDGRYYMILGARDGKNKGCALLFVSDDLEAWTYFDRIEPEEKWGYMWECPDLFDLDGQTILCTCPQGISQSGHDYQNVYQCGYFPVNLDLDSRKYQLGEFREFDKGFDIYATQTFEDEQGRRILIGWMGIPDADYSNDATVSYDWIHALTMPRVLTYRDGKIYQAPMEEMKQLRRTHDAYRTEAFGGRKTHDCCFEMKLDFDSPCEAFTLQLREDVRLSYSEHILTLELGESGCGRDKRTAVIENMNNITVFSDTSSLEIFVNDGETVMTTRVYSRELEQEISLACEAKGEIEFFELGSCQVEGLTV